MSKSEQSMNPLATAPIGKTLTKFAVPAIISNLITSVYNIVDQIFIGQNVGILGNAATNVAFPISIICTAVAILFGFGGAARLNLEMGRGNHEKGGRIVGSTGEILLLFGEIKLFVIPAPFGHHNALGLAVRQGLPNFLSYKRNKRVQHVKYSRHDVNKNILCR